MADIEHNAIADPNIHEPKGAATAATGTVYTSDGAGSGSWSAFPGSFDKQVIVKNAADLAGTLSSEVVYFLDGVIDMGAQSIQVPAGGLTFRGHSFEVSKLISSAAGYALFTSPGGGSGNLLGSDYALEITGVGSQVYSLTSATGFDAFELARVNYNDCTSLGEITNYRQGFETGTGRFGGTPNLTLSGAWVGGYFIDSSIVRSLDAGMTGALFQEGTGFSMASRFRSNMNVDLPASAAYLDFIPANFTNPSTLQLTGMIISRNGVFDAEDSNLTPNISSSDLASAWNTNVGLNNTFEGGKETISSETATSVASSGVFYDLDGTWTASDLQHFDSPSNGQLRHLGNSPREYKISGQLALVCTSGNEVDTKVVKYDSATTSFEDIATQRRVINNLQGGRDVAYFMFISNVVLDTNDYVKLQVSNVGATNNITAELDSFFVLEDR